MKLGYRKVRSLVILFAGLLALALSHTMDGYAVVLGISLLVSSAFTLVYVFLHFDKNINPKIVIEMIVDGFSGLVLFTYPKSDHTFLLIVFSFWILMIGALYLTSGLMTEKNKPYMWTYALVGIVLMVLGFVVMHYETEYLNSVLYLLGFTLLIYAGTNLYLLFKRKIDIY